MTFFSSGSPTCACSIPPCGSGNFLYLALQALKDLERRAIVEAVDMGLALRAIHCGPHNVKGIEINP